jgi:hypothetical protein
MLLLGMRSNRLGGSQVQKWTALSCVMLPKLYLAALAFLNGAP